MKDRSTVLLGIVSGIALCAIAVIAYVYKEGYGTPVGCYVSTVLACYLAFLVFLCFRLHKEFLLESKNRELEILDKELDNKKNFLDYEMTQSVKKAEEENKQNAKKIRELEQQLKICADQDLLVSRFSLFLYSLYGKGKKIDDIDLKEEFEKAKGNYKELQKFVKEMGS